LEKGWATFWATFSQNHPVTLLSLSPSFQGSDAEAGLPDFSWSKHTKMVELCQITANYTKRQ
jgi:hypothetical protein